MKPTLRALVMVLAIGAMAAVWAPPVAAAKGAGGLPPAGNYRFDFTGADYSTFANNDSLFLDVSNGTDVARPDGAPATTTSGTQFTFFLFDNNTFTFTEGCFMLAKPSDFTIANRLGSATLNTTVGPSTPSCPGFGQPLDSTMTFSAVWTGVGPLANSTGASNYSCATYTEQSSNRGLTNTAIANLTLTEVAADGTTTTTAFPPTQTALNFNHFDVQAHGALDPGCGLTGFGIGPTPAGHFHFFGLFSNGFFGEPPFSFDQVSLTQSTSSGSVAENDLTISLPASFGCFIVPSADIVNNGLVSATLNTTIQGPNPPACSGTQPFNLNFPMNVITTWTGEGPVMSVHDQNNYQCQGYTQTTSTFVKTVNATSTATITMPDYLGNPQTQTLDGGFGNLSQVTQSIQANGALPQSCLIRD